MAADITTMTDEERDRAHQAIEEFFEFVRDIIEDATPLQDLPDKAVIDLTPLEQAGPRASYATTTRRFAVTVVNATAHERTAPRSDRHSA